MLGLLPMAQRKGEERLLMSDDIVHCSYIECEELVWIPNAWTHNEFPYCSYDCLCEDKEEEQ
jgi:hypothetical protein